jgi:hypothetical protein
LRTFQAALQVGDEIPCFNAIATSLIPVFALKLAAQWKLKKWETNQSTVAAPPRETATS